MELFRKLLPATEMNSESVFIGVFIYIFTQRKKIECLLQSKYIQSDDFDCHFFDKSGVAGEKQRDRLASNSHC